MENMYNVSSSPHIKDNSSTRGIMADVCIAMIPAAAFGVYQFGLNALLGFFTTVGECVGSDY